MAGSLSSNVFVDDDQSEEEEFVAALAAADTMEGAIKLYDTYNWSNQTQRIFDRALELVTTTKQALSLSHYADNSSESERATFDKALEKAQTGEDLDLIFHFVHDNPACFKYRNVLRKVFDIADKLGMPTHY